VNKSEHKKVEQYLRQLGDLLELRDWTLELETSEPDDESDAHVHITYGRKLAQVYVANDIVADRPRLRQSLVHELVHCHLESATNMVLNDLSDVLGKPVDHVFWAGYKRQVEYATDALATALARRLPLMPK
jgi:hypothetical protein